MSFGQGAVADGRCAGKAEASHLSWPFFEGQEGLGVSSPMPTDYGMSKVSSQ